jgi:hypothetical protein
LSADTAGAFGSSGSVALTTPLSFFSRAVAPFAAEPNFCPRMSSAVVDSWPGMRNVSTVLPDSVSAPTPAATSSSSQTPSTATRCR